MMSLRTCLTVALALVAGGTSLSAQSASTPAKPDSAGCCQAATAPTAKPDCPMMQRGRDGMGMGMGMGMEHRMGPNQMMDMPMPTAADEARLDSLVTRMHQSKGDKKLVAMEKVVDELLAHRAAMREHMRHMMDGMDSPAPSPEHQHQ